MKVRVHSSELEFTEDFLELLVLTKALPQSGGEVIIEYTQDRVGDTLQSSFGTIRIFGSEIAGGGKRQDREVFSATHVPYRELSPALARVGFALMRGEKSRWH